MVQSKVSPFVLCLISSTFITLVAVAPFARADSPDERIGEAIAVIGAATEGDTGGEAVTSVLRRLFEEGRIKVRELRGEHGQFSEGEDGQGEITIDPDLLEDPIRLISTLIHEALHALDGYDPSTANFPGMIRALIDHINVYLEQIRLLLLISDYLDRDDITEYILCIIDEILRIRIPELRQELEAWLKRAGRTPVLAQ